MKLTRTNKSVGNFTSEKSQFLTGFRSKIGVRSVDAVKAQEGKRSALFVQRWMGTPPQSSPPSPLMAGKVR